MKLGEFQHSILVSWPFTKPSSVASKIGENREMLKVEPRGWRTLHTQRNGGGGKGGDAKVGKVMMTSVQKSKPRASPSSAMGLESPMALATLSTTDASPDGIFKRAFSGGAGGEATHFQLQREIRHVASSGFLLGASCRTQTTPR